MKTLIVEDDAPSRMIMHAMLAPFGECVLASNGMEAISAFKAEADKGAKFDLVCLDIMLPELSGHEVLKSIRTIEEECGILPPNSVKIVMTSAMHDPENILGAFTRQCDAYLVKPIEYEQLVEKIRFLDLEKEAGFK